MIAEIDIPTSPMLLSPLGEVPSLWKRALDSAAEGVTISDLSQPDNPIIYANRGFERMTGYRATEVEGRNCRFLQGLDTDKSAVAELRRAIADRRETTVELLNYRKTGEPFWNRLSIRPVSNPDGDVTHFIGVQSDVTRRKNAEDDLKRAKRELEKAYRGLRSSLDAAAGIQQALLPERPLTVDGLDVDWLFEPCEELAGDSLNVLELDDRHVAFYMLDVSGHGAPAALLSVTLSRVLAANSQRSLLFRGGSSTGEDSRIAAPREVLDRLNRQFPFNPQTSQYFTIFYGILDRQTLELRYASSGHPPAALVSADDVRLLDATGFPIGIVSEPSYADRTVQLRPGDRVVVYTDGVTEAPSPEGEEFGTAKLAELLRGAHAQPLATTLQSVFGALVDWHGSPSFPDDLSVLAIEAQPSTS